MFLISLFSEIYGCAFTQETVKIDYAPQNYPVQVASSKTIAVEKLHDQRGVEPHLIAYKGNTGPRTTGTYVSEQEVADVITDAIKLSLSKMGYSVVVDAGDLSLTGDILKLDSYSISGFPTGAIETIIQLNLKLIGNKEGTGTIIWSEVPRRHRRRSERVGRKTWKTSRKLDQKGGGGGRRG